MAAIKKKQQQKQQQQPPLSPQQQQQKQLKENDWLLQIQAWYPDRRTRALFLPPLWFNRVPYEVVDVAGESVLKLLEKASDRTQLPSTYPAKPPPAATHVQGSSAGQIHVWASPSPQPSDLAKIQDSDRRDDEANQQFLEQLGGIARTHEVMMVISGLDFKNYLTTSGALFPVPKNVDTTDYRRGEFDVLIIHRDLGFVVCEIKAVKEGLMTIEDLNKTIVNRVEKAVQKQLTKEEAVLKHLVSDIQVHDIHITKALILPNITSSQLHGALATSTNLTLEQGFITCLGARDTALCLCKDETPSGDSAISTWWERLKEHAGQDPNMTDDLYDRLLARFCGPDTNVYIPTATALKKVVRTQMEVVTETDHRMRLLVLYPQQLDLLQRRENRMFLYGPPGTGKTVVLVLKAMMWLQHGQNQHVEVVSIWKESCAVSILIEKQLTLTVTGSAPPSFLKRFSYDFFGNSCDVARAAQELKKRAEDMDGKLFLIVDEVSREVRGRFRRLIAELDRTVGRENVSVWCASLHRPDNLPVGMEKMTLTEPLRCPPNVEKPINRTFYMGDLPDCTTPPYTTRTTAVPTKGPPCIHLDQHTWFAGSYGHTLGFPEDCTKCGRNIAHELRKFKTANDPGQMEWRDMLILCDSPSEDSALVRALKENRIPVKVVTTTSSEEELGNMALATNDEVVVTDLSTAGGLERKVVVGMEQTLVTYWCHVMGCAQSQPWTSLLVLLMLISLAAFTPNENLRRLFVAIIVDCCIVAVSVAETVCFGIVKENCSEWLRPVFVLGPVGPGVGIMVVVCLVIRCLVDEVSGMLAVTGVFVIAAAAIAAVTLCCTGFIISGMLFGMMLNHIVLVLFSSVATHLLWAGSVFEVIRQMGGCLGEVFNYEAVSVSKIVEAFFSVAGGTLGGAVAGTWFKTFVFPGAWQGIQISFLISSFLTVSLLVFQLSSDVHESLDTPGNVQVASRFWGLMSNAAMMQMGILLGLHGGMMGRICHDLYTGRMTAGRFYKRVNLVTVLVITCFVAYMLGDCFRRLPASIDFVIMIIYSAYGYVLSVGVALMFGWAQHRQGCYPLHAISRCTSQLVWLDEPPTIEKWLVLFAVSAMFVFFSIML